MCQIPNNTIRFNLQNDFIRNYVIPIGVSTVLSSVASGCLGGVFGVTNFVGGAIFGATAATADLLASKILFNWNGNNEARVNLSLFLFFPLFFVNAAVATAVTTMTGFPITWISVAAFTVAVFAGLCTPGLLFT